MNRSKNKNFKVNDPLMNKGKNIESNKNDKTNKNTDKRVAR